MKIAFFIALFSLFLIAIPGVYADMGPKPSSELYVNYSGQSITGTFYAKMLSCYNNDYDFHAAQECEYESDVPKDICLKLVSVNMTDIERNCTWLYDSLAWGGNCINGACGFHYFLPSEFRLAVYMPSLDKIFVTDSVSREQFISSYEVNIFPDGSSTIVENSPAPQEKPSSIASIDFFTALVVTLLLELFFGFLFVHGEKKSRKILLSLAISNFITLPAVWYFTITNGSIFTFFALETFAFVFEALFVYNFNKKTFSMKKSFILSLIVNMVSLAAGAIIYFITFLFKLIV
jgi:hypothetical protein